MLTIIGLIAMSSWVWSVIIIGKKTKDTTQSEKVALVVALISLILYVLGTLYS